LTGVFGFPRRVAGNFRKTISIDGAPEIDDSYNCLFDYGSFLMTLTVDVVSRHATRRLLINGDKQQLVWDWDERLVRLYDPQTKEWRQLSYDEGKAAAGYNVNIGETMYVEEMRHFFDAVAKKRPFIQTLEDDHAVLRLLYAVEESDRSSRILDFQR
jgi:predicted dehydrogenase